MSCKSCGGSTTIRIERTGIQTSPTRVVRRPIKLGSRKLIARASISTKPANSLDKYRA